MDECDCETPLSARRFVELGRKALKRHSDLAFEDVLDVSHAITSAVADRQTARNLLDAGLGDLVAQFVGASTAARAREGQLA
jgi:pantoate kinase